MKTLYYILTFLIVSLCAEAQKTIYIPGFIGTMNLNDPTSQWCYERSAESENFVLFWEAGFGNDPSTAETDYRVNISTMLEVAELSYHINIDSLRMAIPGASVTDNYKMMIFLLYSTEWVANGSGQDETVGVLHVNPAAARSATVLAHEIGHCFQYITGCDSDGGFRYGFGENGSGGNGFWEQCAQWAAFKVYPEEQFRTHDFGGYVTQNHLHILHEEPRYQNYFLPDFWQFKQGQDFIGTLWRESRYPEDPVEAYKRITTISQAEFNDEIYEHAARLTTWDIPALKPYGANYIDSREQVRMNLTDSDYWQIAPTVCIENYGYNSIKLNVPTHETEVQVSFKGRAGHTAFRTLNISKAGWRFGFVALLKDGTRVYSDMHTAHYQNGHNPELTASFTCPANCSKLWLIVSGAPQEHWRHPWDDDNSNDEQWPYEVQFTNTNLLGIYSHPIHNESLSYNIVMQARHDYTSTPVSLDVQKICHAFSLSPNDISSKLGTEITYYGVNPDGSLNANSTANAPGHWYTKNGEITTWGTNSAIFSELNINTLVAHIGQYPEECIDGDVITIRQALIYEKSATETARVDLKFTISILPPYITQEIELTSGWNLISCNVLAENTDITQLFAQLDVEQIKTAEGFWHTGQIEAFNSLQNFEPGKGYLVKMNSAGTLSISGTAQVFSELESNSNQWNIIGCPTLHPEEFSRYFDSAHTQIIKNFNGFWEPDGNLNSIHNFEPGNGYFAQTK